VPECYFTDWSCPVRENYCQIAEIGSFENPLTVQANSTKVIRAGARDSFGFVFRINGPFTYEVVDGGGSVDQIGRFTAGLQAGSFTQTLRISSGGFEGLSDVMVTPAAPDSIVITSTQQTIGTRQALQYSARVIDSFGNEVDNAPVEWSLVNAQDSTIDPSSGLVTSGCISGFFSQAVVVNYQGVTQRADLQVTPGGAALASISIQPPVLTVQATEGDSFEATVTDVCGYVQPAIDPVFTARTNAGVINATTGVYQASCNVGSYVQGVTVRADGLEAHAEIEIIDAPLAQIRVQPSNAEVRVQASAIFEAIGEDRCGRTQTVQPLWSTTIVNATTSQFGVGSQQQLNVACNDLGEYANSVIARVGDFTAYATVNVLAGSVESLSVAEPVISVPAGSELPILATALDECGNSRDSELRFSTTSGQISSEGSYTAGCIRGNYPSSIIVQAGLHHQQRIDVEISDGVLNSIEIEPETVSIQAGTQRQLRANLFDGCRNLIDRQPTWGIAEGGAITLGGVLTASTNARTYVGAVVAELDGFQDSADLTITPAEADSLTVNPSPLQIEAGSTVDLEVIARDVYGNTFSPEPLWTVSAEAGTVDEDNQFTATEVTGTFRDAIVARVGAAETQIDVEVIAGPVDRLNIQPSPVVIPAGNTVQMTANPVDQYGNATNAPITWSVEGEGGLITEAGLFTADSLAGVYTNSLVARSGDTVSEVTIRVVPNDPVSMRVIPEQLILTPNEQLQLTVQVLDAFDNIVPASPTFSIENTGATVSPSGLLTAGTVSGTYQNTLRIRSGAQELTLNIQVLPGAPIEIQIEPVRLEIEPLQTQQLTATFLDAFDNVVDVDSVWSGLNQGGEVSPTGRFTAYREAGVYPQSVVVRGGGLEAFLDVEVVPGAPTELHIDPELIITHPGSAVPLEVYFTDSQGNRVESDLPVTWSVRPNSLFSISADGTLNVECSGAPDFYAQEVSVTAGTFSAAADVQIRPGETDFIQITPNRAITQVTGTTQFIAEGKDACGFETLAVVRWNVVEGRGVMNPSGRFLADTLAETVVVRATFGDVQANAEVVVQPGEAVNLNIDPSEVSITVDTLQDFVAEAVDQYDNRWAPSEIEWAVLEVAGDEPVGSTGSTGPVGSITEQGVLRSGETSGRFLRSVVATFGDKTATADVYLTPDRPSVLEVTPSPANLIPRQTVSFSTVIKDQFGNEISGLEPIFTCSPEVGACSDGGVLNATTNVGEYPDSVQARLEGIEGVVGRADVVIENSEPDVIEITPSSLVTTVGSLNLFQATVYDTTGVEIEGATVEWIVDNPDLGTINTTPQGDARLAVSRNTGRYFGGVIARVGDVVGLADVIIPRDFDGDEIDDLDELDNELDPRDPEDALLDPDGDGLNNRQEVNAGLLIYDGDSDDDGIADGAEENWGADSDGDGEINANDPDSDNDGVFDGTETGLTQPHQDTEYGAGFFQPDLDPNTVTDPLNPDHDSDGLNDGEEDKNRNGRIDPGETPPTRDVFFIHCDPTAEENICPEGQVCIENICTDPEENTTPNTDDGCNSIEGQSVVTLSLLLLGLFGFTRRRREEH
jgi:hypothetical protein